MTINAYDIDGVITVGIRPEPQDIIITGRSFEEETETLAMLNRRGIKNLVVFNPCAFADKTRQSSGEWKAWAINSLESQLGITIDTFFEDDNIQANVLKDRCPELKVVLLQHDLTEKENVEHVED